MVPVLEVAIARFGQIDAPQVLYGLISAVQLGIAGPKRDMTVNGLGKRWLDPYFMKLFADGTVNFPYLSDGMWFLTQHRRWGLLQQDCDYTRIARQVNLIELYREAASQLHVSLPEGPMRRSVLLDGVVWDGSDPDTYASSFPIRWNSRRVRAEA